jgi:hypothetical protein
MSYLRMDTFGPTGMMTADGHMRFSQASSQAQPSLFPYYRPAIQYNTQYPASLSYRTASYAPEQHNGFMSSSYMNNHVQAIVPSLGRQPQLQPQYQQQQQPQHRSQQQPQHRSQQQHHQQPHQHRHQQHRQPQPQQHQQQPQQPQQPPQDYQAPLNIRGINNLIEYIGYPDVTDRQRGGIAIWSSSTLHSRGYKFLQRVEIIDESVPSLYPVKHFSNVYIWVNIVLTDTMHNNILNISTDIYYDKGKELVIVRSDSLDTAVAQAALIALYSKNKITYYDIVNNNMHNTYYHKVNNHKTKKTIYTILNNLSKPAFTRTSWTGRKRS